MEGTAFGEDVEFAGLYRGGEGLAMPPSSVGEGGALLFEGVAAGTWTLEVTVRTDGPHHLRFEMGGEAAHAGNTAAFADVTSTTPDGRHGPGETVDVRINFTEPVSFEYLGITDGGSDAAGGTFEELEGAFSITTAKIGPYHYALVAADFDDGVQIVNITDPANPTAVANFTAGDTYPVLRDPASITTARIGPYHYALVAATLDDGVQIVNITNPASPAPVANLTDGDTYPALNGAKSITTAQIGPYHYALVAAAAYSGVQIVNITNPASPAPVANLADGPAYPTLYGASSITTAQIGPYHYALVAAYDDHGVQIIDITEPARPFDPLLPYVNLNLEGERRATYKGQGDGGHSLVFEYAVRDGDMTCDLAYDGTDALWLGYNNLTDVDDSADLSGTTLPTPGHPHSLSQNKRIELGAQTDNNPPVVTADSVQPVNEGQNAALSGSATDFDLCDTLRFQWSQASPSDPLAILHSPNSMTTTFTAPRVDADTDFNFTLTVNDGTDDGTDHVIITVRDVPDNFPPMVDAGSSKTVAEGSTVTLAGRATDPDQGDALTYLWSQVSPTSPAIAFADPSSPSTTFTAPQVSSHTAFTLALTATDSANAAGTGQVTITVRDVSGNLPPVASISGSNTIPEGSRGTLAGAGTDPDGSIVSYRWRADNAGVALDNAASPTLAYTAPQVGADTVVRFTLVVTDEDGATGSATHGVTITNTPTPPAPEPAPRSGGGGGGSSSRGGGGGGGGAPAAVITDVRIYSVSWDCAAGTASATAGPDTDQLSVKIRTSSVGERPASPVAAALAETRTFEFPISGADEFAVVQGSLAYEGDQVITKIATLDPCTGTVTFDRYEPPQAAVPEPEPEPDLCGDGWEPALRDGSRLLCLFPGTFETLNERGWGLVRP